MSARKALRIIFAGLLWLSIGGYNLSVDIPHNQCWDRLFDKQHIPSMSGDVGIEIMEFVAGPLGTPAVWMVSGTCVEWSGDHE
jgi:hypothetical protein